MKIIIGAGKTKLDGWISTQQSELDVLCRSDFLKITKLEGISAMLAEHVWEHMDKDEGLIAARNCFDFLEPGGYVRIAVPDANFKNEWYQNLVKIGGNGDPSHPAYTHKIVYDYKELTNVFQQAGFDVELLEWCDEAGDFHYKYWNETDGYVSRSLRYDTRNSKEKLGMVSIIIDAKKPMLIRSQYENNDFYHVS